MEVVNGLTFLLRAEDYIPRVHELQHIPDSLSKNFWFHSCLRAMNSVGVEPLDPVIGTLKQLELNLSIQSSAPQNSSKKYPSNRNTIRFNHFMTY